MIPLDKLAPNVKPIAQALRDKFAELLPDLLNDALNELTPEQVSDVVKTLFQDYWLELCLPVKETKMSIEISNASANETLYLTKVPLESLITNMFEAVGDEAEDETVAMLERVAEEFRGFTRLAEIASQRAKLVRYYQLVWPDCPKCNEDAAHIVQKDVVELAFQFECDECKHCWPLPSSMEEKDKSA